MRALVCSARIVTGRSGKLCQIDGLGYFHASVRCLLKMFNPRLICGLGGTFRSTEILDASSAHVLKSARAASAFLNGSGKVQM